MPAVASAIAGIFVYYLNIDICYSVKEPPLLDPQNGECRSSPA